MIMAIEFLVNSGVFDSEIGAQIHHARAGGQERLGKFGSESVGQSEKNKTRLARDLFWIGIGKIQCRCSLQVREARENLRERCADQLSRCCRDKIDLRMR